MMRLILFFTLSFLMFGGTSMAENQITCNADMLPIQVVENEREKPVTTLYSPEHSISSSNHRFDIFVTTVTEHLATKLAQEKLCLNSTESQQGSLVQFVRISFISPQVERTLFKLRPPAEDTATVCQMASPWLDIIIEKEPVPKVQAIVRFNDRQFLADQAVLEGALNVLPGVAIPLTYEESMLYERVFDPWANYINPEDKPSDELVPPDILWLYRRATFSDLIPGSTGRALSEIIDSTADGYTKVVTTIIDQCFASDGVNIKLNSILDVPDAALLEQYKSDMPALWPKR